MENNTSKVRILEDANSAAATLMNASGAGTSLFVINLCASMAPIANVAKSLPGLESYRLYQVTRREDGRTRYRLRLGFFTSEADAEAVLSIVRDVHPTAFTTCLCDEDRKFTRGYVNESSAPRTPVAATPVKIAVVENKSTPKPAAAVPAPTAKPTPPPVVAKTAATTPKPAPASAAPAKPTAAKAIATPQPARPSAAEDTGATNRMKVMRPTTAKADAKTPVAAKPAAAESHEIELSWDPPALKAPPAAANAPAPQVVGASFKTQDVIKAPAKPAPAAVAKPVTPKAPTPQKIEAPSKHLASIELTLEADPTPPAKKTEPVATPTNEPFRVGRGIEIPTTSLTLESAPVTAPTARAAAAAPASKTPTRAPAAPTPKPQPQASAAKAPPKPVFESKMKTAQANAPAAIQHAAAPAVYKPGTKLPDLDSTQTIRALTSEELKDESQEKWFAIQVAVSDQPMNLDAMPRLDIFEAYRLYSVASAGSGKITHAMRIGFFREEVSAEAVCGYLRTFFNSPTVVRISIAEQARFKDPPAPKAVPKAEILDLSQARASKAIPTVTMEVERPRFDPSATGTFKTSTTGVHKALSTGVHDALSSTGMHRALGATGTHKALKAASKAAPPATKRSAPMAKMSATGKHKAFQPKKSLAEQLLDEAREVELSQSGIRKLPKNDSLLSKMFGKKK